MRQLLAIVAAFIFIHSNAHAAQADCRAIVAATLAEIEAGAPEWDERSAELVRSAAGSACVKALSGIAVGGASTGAAQGAAATSDADTQTDEDAASETADDLWPTLKRNDISGSPNKKPYERARD